MILLCELCVSCSNGYHKTASKYASQGLTPKSDKTPYRIKNTRNMTVEVRDVGMNKRGAFAICIDTGY